MRGSLYRSGCRLDRIACRMLRRCSHPGSPLVPTMLLSAAADYPIWINILVFAAGPGLLHAVG